MPVSKLTVLHVPDDTGGILCDGTFTKEKQNYSSEVNPTCTEFQKEKLSQPGYFNTDDHYIGEREAFCSNCVRIINPNFATETRVHLQKAGQGGQQFAYCGMGMDILLENDQRMLDLYYLIRDPDEVQGTQIPYTENRCDNCQDAYPPPVPSREIVY